MADRMAPAGTVHPACPRDHWKLGRDLPMDRVSGGGWACPGMRPDRSGDCGFQLSDDDTDRWQALKDWLGQRIETDDQVFQDFMNAWDEAAASPYGTRVGATAVYQATLAKMRELEAGQ